MTQHLELAVYVFFAFITLGSALAMVLVEDVWHSALLMGVTLLSIAVHYVMLRAEFVAAMQVLVYVGGVLILISFAVMLVRRKTEDPPLVTHPQLSLGSHLWRGVGAVALFAVLALVSVRASLPTESGFPADGSITTSIGYAMFSIGGADIPSETFLAAFEIIDVVLVAALVGAVMLARRDRGGGD
jgi:NADH-quinone oxidoreductase subunit J